MIIINNNNYLFINLPRHIKQLYEKNNNKSEET